MAISTKVHGRTFNVGDTVDVKYRIIEKDVVSGKTKKEKKEEHKERVQTFSGIVMSISGTGTDQRFLVRHQGPRNVGVERIFPLISPWLKGVVVKKKGDIRRAKLYYLRKKTKKEISRIGTLLTQDDLDANEKQIEPNPAVPSEKTETPAPTVN